MVYYNGGKKAMGNWVPLDDMVALREKLTAEAVAWICITVLPENL